MIFKLKAFTCAWLLICMGVCAQSADAQPSREQSRSMVMTQYGIVATSQAVASQAGAAILARGGNAVDAAIAANAALGVIEPMMNGVGGDLFAIVYDAKTKKLYGLNSSGWAPKAMTIEGLKAKGIVKEIPETGILSVTVPGAVAGWDALRQKFGKLSMAEDLAPAIALAEQGIAVPETDAENWHEFGTAVRHQSGLCTCFSARWQTACRRPTVPQSRSSRDAATNWKKWPRWLLQRRDGGCNPATVAATARIFAGG